MDRVCSNAFSAPSPYGVSVMTSNGPANPRPLGAEVDDQAAAAMGLRDFWIRTRNRLLEGLLVVLPILVTFWIIHWLYSALERYVIDPIAVFVLWKVRRLQTAPELPYWFETFVAPIIAIAIALTIVYCCGVLAHSRLRRFVDQTLLKVPIVAPIYDALRNALKCLESPAGRAAQRVVLVAFPQPGMRLPAIVTSTCRDIQTGKKVLCVYVPTTPPASGFFLLVPEEEATELNWDMQQTLQAIISGGLTAPPDVSYYRTPNATSLPPEASRMVSQSASSAASGRN